jgi:hypothetical protein
MSVFRSPASNLAPRFYVARWLTLKDKGLDWFGRLLYVHDRWRASCSLSSSAGAYNGTLTSGVRVWVEKCLGREKDGSAPPYIVYWAGLQCVRRGASPPRADIPVRRSGALHVSHPRPSVALPRIRSQVLFACSMALPDMASVLSAMPMAGHGAVVLVARPPRSAGGGPLVPLAGSTTLVGVGGLGSCTWSRS